MPTPCPNSAGITGSLGRKQHVVLNHAHSHHWEKGRSSPVMASAVDNTLKSLLFANDQLSGHAFLIDSGAEVIVLPASVADRKDKVKGRTLSAANKS